MTKKAILYIGGFELPDKNAAAQRVIANGKLFKELGYDVYYIGIERTLSKRQPIESTKASFEGFEYYTIKYPSDLSEWLDYLSNIKEVVRIAGKINSLEYVVAYNYPGMALSKLYGWGKSKNIKIISDCTEWYEPQGNILFKMIKGFDTYLRMRVVQPKLDGLIAISSYLYSFYANRMKHLIQLPPLVDAKAGKWEKDCASDNEKLVLVYAGSPGKGAKDRLDAILEALAVIKTTTDIQFLLNVIGLLKQQYIDDFGAEAFPSALEKDVIFKGRLPHTDALKEVKCADYAIFVRDNNLVNTAGFPTKFVEALSCGTPVLSNRSSNIADYLKDGINGYILDNSTKEALVHTFTVALSQGKKQVSAMKAYIKSAGTFDYRNYIGPMEQFLDSVRADNKKTQSSDSE